VERAGGEPTSSPPDDAIATHGSPVWRARADFLFMAQIEDADGSGITHEQLWGRQVGSHRFQVCCIPYFLYAVALGDTVETDDDLLLRRVVKRRGRWVFRARIEHSDAAAHERVHGDLRKLGALTEWRTSRIAAIDAKGPKAAQRVADYLQREADRGALIYETGQQPDQG
jgi:hypothetical protein